jgi:hypothetical protein
MKNEISYESLKFENKSERNFYFIQKRKIKNQQYQTNLFFYL